jgi:hypothetical protein
MSPDFLIDIDSITERVDEYTLYCHYLGYRPDIKVNYTSPFRDDDMAPSFGIFPVKRATREYLWKDSGGKGDSGEIVKLVQKLYGYQTQQQALARILSDFELGPIVEGKPKIVQHVAPPVNDCDIRVRPRKLSAEDLKFWSQFNIAEDTLKLYRTSPLYCYWLSTSQRAPMFAPYLSYVYRVFDKYQLYFPTRGKGLKFRMDLQEHHVHGIEQLSFSSDTLIITKSRKDVMCLRSFGYEAVSPRSENTPMPSGFFDWADSHYKRKLVLFDNDMKHRGDWYPYNKIYVPLESNSKDISDFTRDYGPQAAAELLRVLIP